MQSDKVKRQRRIGQKRRIVKKNLKNFTKGMSITEKFESPWFKQPHRLAEYRNMCCSGPNCMGCRNPRRIFGDLTIQEQRLFQSKLYDE